MVILNEELLKEDYKALESSHKIIEDMSVPIDVKKCKEIFKNIILDAEASGHNDEYDSIVATLQEKEQEGELTEEEYDYIIANWDNLLEFDGAYNYFPVELPKELTIDAETMKELGIIPGETSGDEESDIISDYLSDTYGYTHFGFDFEDEGNHINVYDIKWDMSESLKESEEPKESDKARFDYAVIEFIEGGPDLDTKSEKKLRDARNNQTHFTDLDALGDLIYKADQERYSKKDLNGDRYAGYDKCYVDFYGTYKGKEVSFHGVRFDLGDGLGREDHIENKNIPELEDILTKEAKEYDKSDLEESKQLFYEESKQGKILTADEFREILAKKGVELDEIVNDWALDMSEKELSSMTFKDWVQFAINTYEELDKDLTAEGDEESLETVKANEKEILTPLRKMLNESINIENKPLFIKEGLNEGDYFEYQDTSISPQVFTFELWYLDSSNEYAICCNEILEDYDNSPTYVGTVKENATKGDVMKVIKDNFKDVFDKIGKGCHLDEKVLEESYENKQKGKSMKLIKEEYGPYQDNIYLEEIANEVEMGNDVGYINGKKWTLNIWGNNGDLDDSTLSSEAYNYILSDVHYPIADGHKSYYDLDFIINSGSKDVFTKKDLETIGFDKEDIKKFFKDESGEVELETWIEYEVDTGDWDIDDDPYDEDEPEYDRRKVEKQYGLEDGELDGVSIRDAEEMVGEEEGALDRFILNESKNLTESIDSNTKKSALAKKLGLDVNTIAPSSYDSNAFETDGGQEFLVLDEDEAYNYAEQDIENVFDDLGLESFTPSFQSWIIENALNKDWFEDVFEESTQYYIDDIKEESDNVFENRLISEMVDANILTEDDFDNWGEDNPVVKEEVDLEEKEREFAEYLMDDDPVEWYKREFGFEELSDLIRKGKGPSFDMEKVVEKCIELDGVAHFIATYDGEELDLGDGLYAYRIN